MAGFTQNAARRVVQVEQCMKACQGRSGRASRRSHSFRVQSNEHVRHLVQDVLVDLRQADDSREALRAGMHVCVRHLCTKVMLTKALPSEQLFPTHRVLDRKASESD